MEMLPELTSDQSKEALKKVDEMADGIIASATGLSGLDGLGVFAGNVKAASLLFAVIYALPILFLGIATLYALWVKYPHELHPDPTPIMLQKKHKSIQRAAIFLAVGVLMLFVALLTYVARATL